MATRRTWIAIGAIAWLAAPAHSLDLVADDRSVTREVTPGCCDERHEPAFFAPFSVPGQSSSIDVAPDGLGLDGTADGRVSGFHDGTGNFHGAESVFSIAFRIDGAGSFGMDGCFDSSYEAVPGFGVVRLLAGDRELYAKERYGYYPCEFDPFAFTTDLEPGEYRIEAVVRASGTDSGLFFDLAFQVRDTLHPIPEPAALGTLGIGFGWLGFRTRRRTPHTRGRRP